MHEGLRFDMIRNLVEDCCRAIFIFASVYRKTFRKVFISTAIVSCHCETDKRTGQLASIFWMSAVQRAGEPTGSKTSV